MNRSVAIIKPKQPFVDWANNLPDAEWKTTVDQLSKDSTAYLIPEYDDDFEAKKIIDKQCLDIFEEELFGWCTNESWWPKKITKKDFWEWFDVEFHSVIIDLGKKPIKMSDD